ncbi:G5 and 3D domain-containing protein [Bhargavaea beijingensis]|uniref:G5 and 3D domain-containing protein n=1 Tax=Bhargavaea beijingensis TaxID=426756 RepID=UPI00222461C5|nr:G5 and 3D domain-containing protein [Bhargavaea beijingensis]MCW1929490.1 ubiquitin-like domain-containing protein [Bhargavaea beijingensis]
MSTNSREHKHSRFTAGKKIIMSILTIALFAGVITYAVYEGTKKNVTLSEDGEQTEFRTHADTVGELLDEQDIAVGEHDDLSPAKDEQLGDGASIEWKKARQFTISVDGEESKVWSTKENVDALLADAGIELSEHDAITPARGSEIGDTDTVKIEKAYEVAMIDGGRESKIWTTSTTVADFLSKQGIKIGKNDRVEQGMDEIVKPGSSVKVVRVEKVTDVVEESTDFTVQTKKDNSLLTGKEKVVRNGEQGKVKRTYEIIKEDGKEVTRKLQDEKVVKKPVNKVVAIGTKAPVPASAPAKAVASNTAKKAVAPNASKQQAAPKVVQASAPRSEEPAGGKEFYVTATSYTASCNGCSGITATGINLKANPGAKVIAVDPSVIPLGSKVWVEGYGTAIAGDTGGAIKGNKIDIFVPTKDQAYSFGRKKVKIKILN